MTSKLIVPSIAIGVLVLAGAGALAGVLPLPGGGDPARPPCEELPDVATATGALADNRELADRITGVGLGVEADVATPCPDETRAIIEVTYTTDEERAAVEDVMGGSTGFGVPVQVVEAG